MSIACLLSMKISKDDSNGTLTSFKYVFSPHSL